VFACLRATCRSPSWVSRCPRSVVFSGDAGYVSILSTDPGLVARTDFPVGLKTRYPQQREYARSHETKLSHPVHSSASSIEEELMDHLAFDGRMRPPRVMPSNVDTPGQIGMLSHSRANPAGGGRRRFRPLGRRSAPVERQLYSRWVGSAFTVSHADQVRVNTRVWCGVESNAFVNSGNPAALVLRGSRIGDGQAQGVYGCYRCVMGSPSCVHKSLAAWHNTKHQNLSHSYKYFREVPPYLHPQAQLDHVEPALDSTS